MTKRVLLVVMVVLLMAATVQAGHVGEQTSHSAAGVGFHMRLAPAATFPTGTFDSGEATVERPFWIAETEVTYELWYAVREWSVQNGYTFANAGRQGVYGRDGEAPTVRSQEPVTKVSWRDTIVWCNALSEMLGYNPVYTFLGEVVRDSTDNKACDSATQENTSGFRLPTSSEWELAARYIDGAAWTPGSYASGAAADVNDSDATQTVAWYRANSGGQTRDVSTRAANGLGLYDMTGNVWEWCFDWHPSSIGSRRVIRGASCGTSVWEVLQLGRSSSDEPENTSNFHGFRTARTALDLTAHGETK